MEGGRLSERQNVVVLSAFLRRRRRKRGDSLDPAQDNLQMHFDLLSLNLGSYRAYRQRVAENGLTRCRQIKCSADRFVRPSETAISAYLALALAAN